jgi:dihydrofolate synthase / folylpolyglutamate synthase
VNYEEAEAYLLDLELFGMKFGLERMHKLMTVLGLPQRRFASIHVVGSNGKSSTTRMIAALLEQHGLRTGTYTSPHLRSYAERIEVGEEPLSEDLFAAAVTRVAEVADDEVTQFEALTAAAYLELARQRVEVAVIEAGLGGRWDATNVIPSQVQVLTPIALEHTRWLGSTLPEIAGEKLAVVRDHATLVVAEQPAEVEPVISSVVAARHARLVRASSNGVPAPRRALGAFQRENFALACAAAEAFLGRLDPDAVKRAADSVVVPGRLELVSSEGPLVLYDGAHNPAGVAALADALPEVVGSRPLVAVVGVLGDKDAKSMLRVLLPLCSAVVFTESANRRSVAAEKLAAVASSLGFAQPSECVRDPRLAVERASELAGPAGAVITTGSIYLIADLVRQGEPARVSSL